MNVSIENWWNNTYKGKQKYAEKIPSPYHLVNHKFHTDWPEIELGSPR